VLVHRGVTSVVKGGTIPLAPNRYGGAESLRGAPNHCRGSIKIPTVSQILSSIQYICFRQVSGRDAGTAVGQGAVKELAPIEACKKQTNRYRLCLLLRSNNVDLKNNSRNYRKPL